METFTTKTDKRTEQRHKRKYASVKHSMLWINRWLTKALKKYYARKENCK